MNFLIFLKSFGVIFWLCEPIRMMIFWITLSLKPSGFQLLQFYFIFCFVSEVTFKEWDREGKNEQNNNGVLKGFDM